MKVVGLLAWFDEDPAWLREACTSALRLCDEVVALDGAYRGFPGASADSPPEQLRALQMAGAHVHRGLLWEDQMQKRSALFDLGKRQTTEDDWFFVFDADDRVGYVAPDLRARLERTRADVAVYTYGGDRYHRGLFRALRTLRVEDAHYHYLAERDGRTIHLRGNEAVHDLAPFATVTDLRVHHLTASRTPERQAAAADYRRLVHEERIEATTPEAWARR